MFEIMTTCSKPFMLTIDDDIPLCDLYEDILSNIEYNTILMREDVIDIFIPICDTCVSLPNSEDSVGSFVRQHPNYFGVMANCVWTNVYKVYTMDSIYLERKNTNIDTPVYAEIESLDEMFSVKKVLETTIKMFTGMYHG